MKPTPQISHNRNSGFPLTDYHYQPTGDSKPSSPAVLPADKSPGFHRLSSDFLGTETSRHDATDFFVFTLMGVLCAWPIVLVGITIVRAFNGYY